MIKITRSIIFPFLTAFFIASLSSIASAKTIVLATDSWEPYFGPNMPNNGYFSELTSEAFKRAGYQYRVEYLPWETALQLAEKGTYDGVLGAYYTNDRTQVFTYSKPVTETTIYFFWLKKRNISFESLEDLTPYKIGVVNGYRYSTEFDAADYLTKVGNYSIELNVKLFLKERLDILVGSKEVISVILNKNYPGLIDTIAMSDKPLIRRDLHIMFSKNNKNHQQLAADFDEGLAAIKSDGTFENILDKHGVTFN